MDKFRHIDTWIFDLDNTLYDAETQVFTRVADRMTAFVTDLLKVSTEEANILRKDYWKNHGTTLRGLMMEHKVDPLLFLEHTHDFDISDVPQCAIVREYLTHLPGRKIVFTNAPREFATRMTKHLGIDHHFETMFTIEDANYLPKPHLDTYHAFIKKFGIDPKRACMFEDMEVNLKPAADLGMTTVWFHGKNPAEHPHVHHKHEKLADWLKHTIRKKP
jgi:putative hydrolase of the HAD superfamily